MFLFSPIHFLKFGGKYQPQRSYKNGSYKEKRISSNRYYSRARSSVTLYNKNLRLIITILISLFVSIIRVSNEE